MTPVLASSELAVGRNRFGIGLIDARNQAITAGDVQLDFFKLTKNGTAEKRGDAKAVFRAVQIQSKGFWVAQTKFEEVGQWGAQVTLARAGEPTRSARLNFEVLPRFSAPGYGEPAPRSRLGCRRVQRQPPRAAAHEALRYAVVGPGCPRHPRPAVPPAQRPPTSSLTTFTNKLRLGPRTRGETPHDARSGLRPPD